MPNADPAIQLDRVSRHYTMGDSSVRAVNEVSLSVAENEFLALLGSSGSGKSTLLNLSVFQPSPAHDARGKC